MGAYFCICLLTFMFGELLTAFPHSLEHSDSQMKLSVHIFVAKVQAAMTGNLNFEQEPFPEYNAREEKAKEKARLKEEARLAKEEAKRKEREEKVCKK